jgi:hypothetical protein
MLRPLGFAKWDKRFYFSGHLSVRGSSNNFDPQTMASANEDSGQQQQGAVEDHAADRKSAMAGSGEPKVDMVVEFVEDAVAGCGRRNVRSL